MKKEGLNTKSLKTFEARVKSRHLKHVKEQCFELSTIVVIRLGLISCSLNESRTTHFYPSALHFYQENIKDFTLKHKEHKAAGGKIL